MKVNSRFDKGFQAYLTAYPIDKGLLINFGSTSLEVKRLFRKH